jgi:hypothetical protein
MITKKTTKTTAKATQATKPPKTKITQAPAKSSKADTGAKKMSALDATAKVLGETRKPMTCRELVDQMAAKGYWTSPGGATPWSTLNAAIAREIKVRL